MWYMVHQLKSAYMPQRAHISIEEWFSAVINHDDNILDEYLSTMARSVDNYQETALMKAVRARDFHLIKLLAQHEAGATNDKGYTALSIAAINNLGDACELLALLEGTIHLPDGRTSLMIAASVSANAAVSALVPHQAGQRDIAGMTALMYSVVYGNTDTARLLIPYEKRILSAENKSALIIAAEHYRRDMVQLLYPYEYGLLPDAECIVLEPYKGILDNLVSDNEQDSPISAVSRGLSSKQLSPDRDSFSKAMPPSIDTSKDNSIVKESRYSSQFRYKEHKEQRSMSALSQGEVSTPRATTIRSVRISLPTHTEIPAVTSMSEQSCHDWSPSRKAAHPMQAVDTRSVNVYRDRCNNYMHNTTAIRNRSRTPTRSFTVTTYPRVHSTHKRMHAASPPSKNRSCTASRKTIISDKPSVRKPFGRKQSPRPHQLSTKVQYSPPRNTINDSDVPNDSDSDLTNDSRHRTITISLPRTEEQETIAAMKRYILALERELIKRERSELALMDQNEESNEIIARLRNEIQQYTTEDIEIQQCSTQTDSLLESAPTFAMPQDTEDTQGTKDTYDAQDAHMLSAYPQKILTELQMIQSEIASICASIQQDNVEDLSSRTAMHNPGMLSGAITDDHFIVLIPCNHMLNLTYMVQHHDDDTSLVSINRCPRCGTQPTSVVSVEF